MWLSVCDVNLECQLDCTRSFLGDSPSTALDAYAREFPETRVQEGSDLPMF